MADLESALHYILRVEVGKFSLLEGQRLVALKKFMAVLAQVSRALAPETHAAPQRVSAHEAQLLPPELVVWLDLWPLGCSRPHGLLPCSLSRAHQPCCQGQ